MKLVLKVPKGKAPFIGVEYGEFMAADTNKDLVLDHSEKDYKIVLEHSHRRLQLRLICEELVTVRFYERLEFEPNKLRDWLYITRRATKFNFGHIYVKGNTDHIARAYPGRKPFVLKVLSIEFVTNENGHEENPLASKSGYGDLSVA